MRTLNANDDHIIVTLLFNCSLDIQFTTRTVDTSCMVYRSPYSGTNVYIFMYMTFRHCIDIHLWLSSDMFNMTITRLCVNYLLFFLKLATCLGKCMMFLIDEIQIYLESPFYYISRALQWT